MERCAETPFTIKINPVYSLFFSSQQQESEGLQSFFRVEEKSIEI